MIKLNIQLFGGGDDANKIEDESKNVSFKIGDNNVVIPSYVFSNQGSGWRKDKKQAKTSIAGIAYAQYHGLENLKGVSVQTVRDWVDSSGVQLFDTDGGLIRSSDVVSPDFKFMNLNGVKGDTMNGLNDLFKDLKTAQENGQVTVDGVVTNDNGSFIYRTTPEGKPVPGEIDDDGKPVIKGSENDKNPSANESPLDSAYNQYYNDIFSRNEGTIGKDILDNNVSLFTKEAQNAQYMADSLAQNQAIAQAQGIKQVTDSIKNERMAQLRSGMSESQLADRELQMLMGSVNNFSGQAAAASQERLAAGLGATTAREQAFNQYIDQATALGQNASANYASEVGDLYYKAYQYQRNQQAAGKIVSMDDAIKLMSGQSDKQ